MGNITGQFNVDSQVLVSEKFIHAYLSNFTGRGRKKIRICEPARNIRIAWARGKRWTVDHNWSRMIFLLMSVKLIWTNNTVCFLRKAGEECLQANIGHDAPLNLKLWGCINWNWVSTLTVVNGKVYANQYVDIMEAQFWPSVVSRFASEDFKFQDDNAPFYQARIVQEYE